MNGYISLRNRNKLQKLWPSQTARGVACHCGMIVIFVYDKIAGVNVTTVYVTLKASVSEYKMIFNDDNLKKNKTLFNLTAVIQTILIGRYYGLSWT